MGLSVVGLLIVLIVLGSIGEEGPDTSVVTQPRTTTTRPKPRPRPQPPPTASLVLIPTGEVYVCLRNADDKLIINETLTPNGGRRSFRGRRFRLEWQVAHRRPLRCQQRSARR